MGHAPRYLSTGGRHILARRVQTVKWAVIAIDSWNSGIWSSCSTIETPKET